MIFNTWFTMSAEDVALMSMTDIVPTVTVRAPEISFCFILGILKKSGMPMLPAPTPSEAFRTNFLLEIFEFMHINYGKIRINGYFPSIKSLPLETTLANTVEEKTIHRRKFVVAATAFLSLFSLVGIMFYGLPFFYDFWIKEFGWSRYVITSGNAVGKLVVGPVFGFFAGWIIDKFGPRRLMLTGIVMGGLALIGLSMMTALWQFYIFYLFNALGYLFGGPLPNQVLISRWFSTTRGKVMGIAYLGIGVGGMFVPQIAKALNVSFGWRGGLLCLGVLMIAIAFPMAWFVKDSRDDSAPPATQPSEPATKVPFGRIFKKWPFYLLVIGSVCSIGAVSGTSQNLKLFMSIDLKYSQQMAANVMSIVLGSSIIGRLFMGWLADRIPKKYVMILIYFMVAASIPLLYASKTEGVIYLFAFLFGMALGGDYMIIPLMAAELFGVKVLGRVMGIVISVDGLGEAFGPMIAARLRDISGNYVNGFAALIILAFIGTIAISLLPKKGNLRDQYS
jgi:sugar phosphate permease